MIAGPSAIEPTLTRRAQRWLQLAWLIVVLPVVALYLVALAFSMGEPMALCSVVGPNCTEAAAVAALASIGLSPAAAAFIAFIFSDLGVPLGCLLIAAFIFWRRPERLIALAIAAMLALYGPVINTDAIDFGLAELGLAALIAPYHLLYHILFCYVGLTFPTGRFVPRWGWLLLALQVAGSAIYLLTRPTSGAVPLALQILPLVSLALQLYRYRRASSPTERQQTRWVLFGLAAYLLNNLIYIFVIEPPVSAGVEGLPYLILFLPINFVLVLSLPAALMFASLRYRLWDVDVIIRRTLVYSVVTALLALVYLGVVVSLQGLFQAITGERQGALVTVLSTLVIAALFGPLRTRVQAAIDRRFNRRAYDAAKIIAAFGLTLRDELELDSVTDQLVDVVVVTLQPADAHLWLKPVPREPTYR
jgi:hypothetical protein